MIFVNLKLLTPNLHLLGVSIFHNLPQEFICHLNDSSRDSLRLAIERDNNTNRGILYVLS